MDQLVVVGSVALDTIETPFGKIESGLGGSATYFSLCAAQFTDVGLVGVVGADFPDAHKELLSSRGVDLSGFVQTEGETFRWIGEYSFDLNVAKTLDTQLNCFASFQPVLPESYRDAKFVFLANIDPELQSDVLDQVNNPTFVACDTMNYWISGKRDALVKTLGRVDAVLINDAEVRQLAGEQNVIKAIQAVHQMGPKVVVIKRGEYGALLSSSHGFFFVPAFPLEGVRDPTGAGDTFAGGFMGFLASRGHVDAGTLRQGVIAGSIMASFCVEDFCTKRMEELTLDEIRQRARDMKSLMDPHPLDQML